MSTVTNVADALLAKEFICECGLVSKTARGRSSIMLDIRKEQFKAFGIGVNATQLTIELIDLDGKQYGSRQYQLNKTDARKNIANIKKAIGGIFKENRSVGDSILGIGVAIPGFVEYDRKNLDGETITFEWSNEAITEALENAFGCGVVIRSVSSSSLSRESYFGVARDYRHAIYVNISGGGIGWARILDMVLDKPAADTARAFGHMTMNFNGPLCSCGQPGCLEVYTDKNALVGNYLELAALDKERTGAGLGLSASIKVGFLDVLAYAEAGDYVAVQAVGKSASIAGLALANMVALYQPELVILAGRIVEKSPLFFDIATSVANKKLIASIGKNFVFKISSLNSKTAVSSHMQKSDLLAVGAASLVFEGIFSEESS